MSKSVRQWLFDLGTVRLNTAGSDAREVTISYLTNPETLYGDVSAIIGEGPS